jgi:hypothetical protein
MDGPRIAEDEGAEHGFNIFHLPPALQKFQFISASGGSAQMLHPCLETEFPA